MSTVAIIQSNFLPWRGYFDIIKSVDHFVIYDTCQYTKRDWRNRNKIKTNVGVKWITVPVLTKGRYLQEIKNTLVVGEEWKQEHLMTFQHAYSRANNFDFIYEILLEIYQKKFMTISEVNLSLIKTVNSILKINTSIHASHDFNINDTDKNGKLISICKQLGATTYVTGAKALDYLDFKKFDENGIQIKVFRYKNYPVYPQLWGNYVDGLSIVDLLFNCGSNSKAYL